MQSLKDQQAVALAQFQAQQKANIKKNINHTIALTSRRLRLMFCLSPL